MPTHASLPLELDALVETTGLPEVGARVAMDGIENHLHEVMLNVEADVVVGPILAFASSAGRALAAGTPNCGGDSGRREWQLVELNLERR